MTDVTDLLSEQVKVPGSFMVVASDPALWAAHFARVPHTLPGEDDDIQLRFSAAYSRDNLRNIGVELSVTLEGTDWLNTLVVAYRVAFVVVGEIEDAELARVIDLLARQIGPSTVYPYARETVAALTGRSGKALTLPLINWGSVFKGDLGVPEPAGETPPHLLKMPERDKV